jgi:hypothetical protein
MTPNTIQEFITSYENEVFAYLQHEEITTEEEFFDKGQDLTNTEADEWATRCGVMCAKKFVEQYGVFKAMKLYDDQGFGAIPLKDEDTFHRLMLYSILAWDTEATSYQAYQTYCEANPLESE